MDPIVVLGSRVKGARPGPMLRYRLWKALEIAHPGQLIIVSGWQEAAVMAQFLREKGHAHVLEEPLATSTNENLENSRRLAPDATALNVVTSNFHALRTRLWAWHLGIPVRVIAAPTPRRERLFNYVREVVATPHSALRIVVRKVLAHLKN